MPARLPLLLVALLLARVPASPVSPAAPEDDADDDDESDSAPFMIVVEHASLWRCSGSLVSLRTAVTSAACARGRGPPPSVGRALWALSAAAAAGQAPRSAGARRVVRVAVAGTGGNDDVHLVGASAWGAALLDMAVLELEAPFGSGSNTRPILMATSGSECGGVGAVCHVVRALPRNDTLASKLRIVDATLAKGTACAALARYWASVRDQTLCLTGPELCPSDWGAGVVCGGKLCGVVSRSARERPAGATAGADVLATYQTLVSCGNTHVAQSVARWRHFLHCAHTLRACGRGDCADLCNERRLIEPDREASVDTATSNTQSWSQLATAASTASPGPPDTTAATLQYEDDEMPPPTSAHEVPTRVHSSASTSAPPRATTSPRWSDSPTRTRHTPGTRAPTEPSAPPALLTPSVPPAPPAPSMLAVAPSPFASSTHHVPPSSRTLVASTTRASALTAHLTSTPTAHVSVRPTPLFEPNRPDFKSGEYGDNAADYVAPVDEPSGSGASGGGARKQTAPTPGHTARSDRLQQLDRQKRPEQPVNAQLSPVKQQHAARPPHLPPQTERALTRHEEDRSTPIHLLKVESRQHHPEPSPHQVAEGARTPDAAARRLAAVEGATHGEQPPAPAVQVERLRQKQHAHTESHARALHCHLGAMHIYTSLFSILNYVYIFY